jgi:hypothetical protein
MIWFFLDLQSMRVSEEPICILQYLFQQNPVFTSLHLRSPVHVVPPQMKSPLTESYTVEKFINQMSKLRMRVDFEKFKCLFTLKVIACVHMCGGAI